MKETDYRITFRVDEEYKQLLEELVKMDEIEAHKMNRAALNRSQIIIQAIKEYYAAHVNGKAQNSYLDLIEARLTQVLDGYFSAERSHITNTGKRIKADLSKTELMVRLILMGTELSKREDLVRKLLKEDAAFEAPINELIEERSGR